LFFVYTLIINHCFSSPALIFIPGVLWAIVTEVSLLITGVTLNFAYVSSRMTWSLSSSLEESSMWGVSPSRYVSSLLHCSWVYFFASSDSPSCSSGRGIHGVWVGELLGWCPSSWLWFGCASSLMHLQPCFHVHVHLLPVNGCLLSLFVRVQPIELKYFLV